jgi:ubiquinone/menaquinone biosynthesis C-methylase UbiE
MSFDRIAPHYAWIESLFIGETLQRCRVAFLGEAAGARHILLIGEGHGRFLVELLRACPGARVVCVDASGKMIAAARARLARSGLSETNVEFVVSPILDYSTAPPFDLVVAQFFLDCFSEDCLRAIVQKIHDFISPGGKLLLCDFQVPSAGWRWVRAKIVLWIAYSFFKYATSLPAHGLAPPQPFLRASGLTLLGRREFNFQLLYSEVWRRSFRA